MKTETTREIAERIVTEWADAHQVTEIGPGTKTRLVTAVEAELNTERERAAKIAETAYTEFQTGHNAGKYIAEKIRGSNH